MLKKSLLISASILAGTADAACADNTWVEASNGRCFKAFSFSDVAVNSSGDDAWKVADNVCWNQRDPMRLATSYNDEEDGIIRSLTTNTMSKLSGLGHRVEGCWIGLRKFRIISTRGWWWLDGKAPLTENSFTRYSPDLSKIWMWLPPYEKCGVMTSSGWNLKNCKWFRDEAQCFVCGTPMTHDTPDGQMPIGPTLSPTDPGLVGYETDDYVPPVEQFEEAPEPQIEDTTTSTTTTTTTTKKTTTTTTTKRTTTTTTTQNVHQEIDVVEYDSCALSGEGCTSSTDAPPLPIRIDVEEQAPEPVTSAPSIRGTVTVTEVTEEEKKGFPLWIIFVIIGLILIALLFWLFGGKKKEETEERVEEEEETEEHLNAQEEMPGTQPAIRGAGGSGTGTAAGTAVGAGSSGSKRPTDASPASLEKQAGVSPVAAGPSPSMISSMAPPGRGGVNANKYNN